MGSRLEGKEASSAVAFSSFVADERSKKSASVPPSKVHFLESDLLLQNLADGKPVRRNSHLFLSPRRRRVEISGEFVGSLDAQRLEEIRGKIVTKIPVYMNQKHRS